MMIVWFIREKLTMCSVLWLDIFTRSSNNRAAERILIAT